MTVLIDIPTFFFLKTANPDVLDLGSGLVVSDLEWGGSRFWLGLWWISLLIRDVAGLTRDSGRDRSSSGLGS